MNTAPIRIRGLRKSFGTHKVLQDLDWEIPSGSIVGLLGRNAAGKSTLIECMLGLRDGNGGTVEIFGENPMRLSESTKARIGYVPQSSDLFEWLTARQLIRYFRPFYTRWNEGKVESLMQRWDLPWDKPISKLSQGQKQRLSIIRALAHEPELLVLDEPVSSLDPAGRREFLRELVDGVIDRQTTVLFSTHILSDLERVAMEVAFLKDGRIALQQPLDALMEQTVRITGAEGAISQIAPTALLSRKQMRDGTVRALVQLDAEARDRYAKDPAIRIEAVGLEDLFIEATQ